MKITKEHYNHMYQAMAAKLADTPKEDIEEYKETIKADGRAKDKNVRIAFDLMYAAGLNGFVCDILYKYVDDTHIKTAVLDICRRLGFTID